MKTFKLRKKLAALTAVCLAVVLSAFPVCAADSEAEDITGLVENIVPDLSEIPLSTTAPSAAETKITISFRLGDSTLKINGADVTVATPFEENGTTLVPLRVITEAFGAKVDWNDADQSITLTCGDTTINLQIDSAAAEINGESKTLPLAPRLVNDTTMVPLRFITENFGAAVSYDEKTEAVLVEKTVAEDAAVDDYSSILRNSDKEYTGDSYYGWKMKSSRGLDVALRTFDGRLTALTGADDSRLAISVSDKGNSSDDEIFSAVKSKTNGITVAREDAGKDLNGNSCLTVEGRTSSSRILLKAVICGDKVFSVYASAPTDSESNDLIGLAESFAAGAKNFSDACDLSEVKDGKRHYENKKVGVSMDLPADWRDLSDSNVENDLCFSNMSASNKNYSMINIAVQSKNNVGSAEKWAQKDYELNKSEVNPDCAKFSGGLESGTLADCPTFYYTYEITYEKDGSTDTTRDVFFEKGEYVYNIAFRTADGDLSGMDGIISSIQVDELDFGKVGSLLVKYPEDDYTKYTAPENVTFSAPSGRMVINTGDAVMTASSTSSITVGAVRDFQAVNMAKRLYESYGGQLDGFKKISEPVYKGVGGRTGYYSSFSYIDKSGYKYVREIFVTNINSICVIVESDVKYESMGERAKEIFEKAVESLALADA